MGRLVRRRRPVKAVLLVGCLGVSVWSWLRHDSIVSAVEAGVALLMLGAVAVLWDRS